MTQRPYNATAHEVQGILAGRISQLRRVVKPGRDQDWLAPETLHESPSAYPCMIEGEQWAQFRHPLAGKFAHGVQNAEDSPLTCIKCTFGKPGDVLWFREALYWSPSYYWKYKSDDQPVLVGDGDELAMVAWCHHKDDNYCASICMPRWASRISREIVSVRVERVSEITDEDALKCGIRSFTKDGTTFKYWCCDPLEDSPPEALRVSWVHMPRTAKEAYTALHLHLHGLQSWRRDWTWVVDTKEAGL